MQTVTTIGLDIAKSVFGSEADIPYPVSYVR
jgi:hypothetical protein